MSRRPHDIMGIPPEDPGVAPEYQTPPDEFNRFAKSEAEAEQKPSRLRKIMLYVAAAGLIALGFFTPKRGVLPPADAQATAAPTLAPEKTPGPTIAPNAEPDETPEETVTPSDTPSPLPTDTPGPTEVPYPLRSEGTIRLAVFADMLDENYNEVVLADETFDEATFDHYDLPPLPTQSGYTPLGYVLLSTSGFEYFNELYFDNGTPHAIGSIPLGMTVTAEELSVVAPDADGVRYVEIHTTWLGENPHITLQLDDGEQVTEYLAGFPAYSEGLFYLAALPRPAQAGRTFAGWFDADGNEVDAVTYFDFFTVLPNAQTMEDRDWNAPIPKVLYAHWK